MTEPVFIYESAGLALTAPELAAARARFVALGQGTGPAADAAPAQSPVAERWLSSPELAELTGVGDTWWEAAAKRGEVPHVRAGKALRFKLSEVETALRERHAVNESASHMQMLDFKGRKPTATKKQPRSQRRLSCGDSTEIRGV